MGKNILDLWLEGFSDLDSLATFEAVHALCVEEQGSSAGARAAL
jgi:hypothetical protein